MKKQGRINIDFSNSRSRYSQRTNEATLVVGRKPTEDPSSKTNDQTSIHTNVATESTDKSNNNVKNKLLMLKVGRKSDSSNSIKENLGTPPLTTNFNPKEEIKSSSPMNHKPVTLTVKFHEVRTSPETVLVDPMLVPGAKPGDIGEIQCIYGSKKKFFFKFQEFKSEKSNNDDLDMTNSNISSPITSPEFKNEQTSENTSSSNNIENTIYENPANNIISILSGPIVTTLDLKPRSQVLVRLRSKDSVQADTIEIYVKDIHLSRGDMWNISGLMIDKCIHKNQKLSFINNSIRLSVDKIYKNGHKFFSSYVGKDTKIVFRSDSARLIVFIQISSDMWHFEESGQQMFHKLVNSFFPKAFQKWKDLGTHHLITIILFSSVDLAGENIRYSEGETPSKKTDYYRVVVDQVHILLWNEIMATLRLEFANFKKEIYLHKNKKRDENHPQEYLIEGDILPSAKGSILEAINLGMSLVSDDFRNSYLRQTTNHFIMITPGTGLFDVSYDMLIRTSKLMSTSDATVDIICLSQAPLHIVPLVRYLDNQNRLKHCIPNWLDISFWTDSSQAVHQWLPKCKIYDLQMMGVMENELSNVNINDLELPNYGSAMNSMDSYDRDVFNISATTKKIKKYKNKHVILSPSLTNKNFERSTSIPINTHGKSDEGLKPAELIVTNSKSSPATCNAFGVSTTSKPNVSAFSTLLSLSKNTDTKTTSSTAYNFVKKMISTPILRPSSPSSEKNTNPNSNPNSNTNSISNSNTSSTTDLSNIEVMNLDNSLNTISKSSVSQPISGRSSTRNGEIPPLQSKLQQPQSQQQLMLSKINNKSFRKKLENKKSTKKKNQNDSGKDSISNTYWANISNPSNKVSSELLSMISYGRWRFVFPPNIKRKSIKWTSLSSPASLPILTNIFPTLTDFNQNYTFRIYDVILNQDIINENQTSLTLMKNMISLRLTLGFQICIGDNVIKVEKHRKPNGDSKLLIQFLNTENYLGSRVYLSLGNEIHRICCDYNRLINVQVYKRVSSSDEQLTLSNDKEYIENIRTRYSEQYLPVKITNSNNLNLRSYNWNQLDQVLAGYNESIDKQKYHRMKFVILPAAIPENIYSISNEKLSTEEIRLEGIRSLIMNIYKIRFRNNEEKKINKRLEIAPEIYFYTGSLFNYLNHESESYKKCKNKGKVNSILNTNSSSSSLTSNGIKLEQLNKSIDKYKLIQILQSNNGIPIVDRYWHLKFYKYCFIGMDLVNFLISNFKDIETREEAVEFGNRLMEEKVFLHVVSKHHFLDGHYFYYINKKFTTNEEQEGEVEEEGGGQVEEDGKEETIDDGKDDGDDDEHNQIMLSKEVLCNLDPNGYSWQPELIKVHYDIVHNPNHCFHLRIEWLNTTSKLIEDSINGWSKYCERYGLSLVEIPWEELFTLPNRNPLHSTIEIKLSINPWEDVEFCKYEEIFEEEKYYFHLYLLKKCGFLLDNRTATYFKDDKFDVVYSWGKPMFKYAQFIHSTGGYITELRNNGDFFMAPNNAHVSRLNLNIGKSHNLGKSKAIYFDSQSVMLEFRSYCQDENRLREIFREGVKSWENDEDFL